MVKIACGVGDAHNEATYLIGMESNEVKRLPRCSRLVKCGVPYIVGGIVSSMYKSCSRSQPSKW